MGAGGGGFDAACRQALASCGIDPDNFGSYSQRLASQAKARDDYRAHRIAEAKEAEKRTDKRPVPPELGGHDPGCLHTTKANARQGDCSCYEGPRARDWYASEGRPNDFLVANAESGHECQNAFSQAEGRRGDPCANVPPPTLAQQNADGGSYGYDMERAACMDHYGAANLPGTPHYEVTQNEVAFAESLKPDLPDGRVSRDAMRRGVRETALVAVRGPSVNNYPGSEPKAVAAARHAQSFQQEQQAQAARLRPKEGLPPNFSGTDAEKRAMEEKAADCIVSHWEFMVDEMRVDSIQSHSIVAKSEAYEEQRREENKARAAIRKEKRQRGEDATEPAAVERFRDLPEERKFKVVRDPRTQAALKDEQQRLEALGATRGRRGAAAQEAGSNEDGTPRPATPAEPPSPQDCRRYQANWLANATYGPQGTGRLPAFTGRPPYKAPAPTGDSDDAGSLTTL